MKIQKLKNVLFLRNTTRWLCTFVWLFICLISTYAQSGKQITGLVVNELEEPMIGVTIKVTNNKSNGTITDVDGHFSLRAAPGETLEFSYIGYQTKNVKIGGATEYKVVLHEDSKALDEVVVVGYGTQKKATLTGAVSALDNEQLTMTKNENVVNMLSGKVPGIRISQRSSQPGAFDTAIDIRGMGEPLIVVDGIPRDKDYFSRMDASEIENLSVLKDASAAIYGLRSANGVIVVTTKRGASDSGSKIDISYSMNYGWQQFLYVPNPVGAADYMTLKNEDWWRRFDNNYMTRQNAVFTEEQMQPYRDGTLQSTDWMAATFDKTSPQQQHNLSVSGGSEKIKYYFNLGYMKQMGAYKSHSMNYDRWNFRTNIDAQITKRLKTSLSLSGYVDEKNEPHTDIWSVYKKAWVNRTDVPIYANGNPLYPCDHDNLYEHDNLVVITDSKKVGYRKDINRVFNGGLSLNYDIPGIEGLAFKALYSYDFRYLDKTEYKSTYNYYSYNDETDQYIASERNSPSTIQRSSYPDYKTLMQLSLNYSHKFGNHNVSGLLLFEEEYSSWDSFYAKRELKVASEYLFAGEDENQVGYMGDIGERLGQALVGKFNYDYKGKYLAEFSFRYDGSSRFPKNARWGFFPAASIGWRISEEAFVKEHIDFLNNLKLRASYGKMGDDRSANTYPPTVVGYNLDNNNKGWYYNGVLMGGVTATSVSNPNLTWYTSKTLDIGLDFDLWNGLLGGSVDYFRRDRDGLLAQRASVLPGTVGVQLPQENLESDCTMGYEFSLSHRNKINDFSYNLGVQFSATKNRWKDKVETPAGNSYEYWRSHLGGRNKDIWWGKDKGGQFQSYNQIYHHNTNVSSSTLPGDYWYQDWNEDGVINDMDNHPIASQNLPVFNYGITLGAAWKGLDLSMSFQGTAGVYTQYGEVLAQPLAFDGGALDRFLDRWHPQDPNADYFDPSTKWVSGYYPVTGSPVAEGTAAVQNASYLRLKTLEIGYTLPSKWLLPVGVRELRIYFSGYNLLTFTGLRDMDPERPGIAGSGASTWDWAFYNYPVNKSYNIGASIKF